MISLLSDVRKRDQNKIVSKMLPLRISWLIVAIYCCAASGDRYYEEAFVKPLASGHINTYFQFTTEWHFENVRNCKSLDLSTMSTCLIPITSNLLQWNTHI